VLALYGEERHVHLVGILNTDPKTNSLIFSAKSTWMHGYPEQAVRILGAADDHARRRGHPFALGWALTTGAQLFDHLREPSRVLRRVEQADRVGRENSLPFLTECRVPVYSGIALIRKGQTAEGVALLQKGLAVWEAGGGGANSPYYKTVLAEGLAELGDLDRALDLIDEVVAQVERPGWEERWYYAETLRIKGWMLAVEGDVAAAERAYIASLGWARQQQARSWELRTATSYARLMRDQGCAREAHDLLASVYAWFTEGFATKDLKDAKALLQELEATGALEPVAPA
jgi:predicted ATPase